MATEVEVTVTVAEETVGVLWVVAMVAVMAAAVTVVAWVAEDVAALPANTG